MLAVPRDGIGIFVFDNIELREGKHGFYAGLINS